MTYSYFFFCSKCLHPPQRGKTEPHLSRRLKDRLFKLQPSTTVERGLPNWYKTRRPTLLITKGRQALLLHSSHSFYFPFFTSAPVALNFQTACTELDINQGRFLINGKGGYVLKPAYMRDGATEFDPITLTRGDWLQHKTLHVMVRSPVSVRFCG